MRGLNVSIKTEQDVEKLRISGRLAAEVLAMIGEHVRPGVTTEYLDDICHDFIVNTLKVTPANIGYHGYTKPPVFLQMKWSVTVFHRRMLYSKMAILLILMWRLLKMATLVIPVVCITWVQ